MSKAVKYYSSTDQGAPQLLQSGWGHMVNLYRTLCTGYNEQSVVSISYDLNTKLVTINFANNNHGFRRHQTLRITGTTSQYNDLDLFVVKINQTSIECTYKAILAEVIDDSVNIKCKVAPLGLIHEYTDGVGKSAFRFPDEDPLNNVYLCINDTKPTQFTWSNNTMCAFPSVYMCRDLTGIDGDATNIVPYSTTYPNAYKASEWKPNTSSYWFYGLMGIMYQGNMNGSSFNVNNSGYNNLPVKWRLIGNQDVHYLYIYPNVYGTMNAIPLLYVFGKYTKKYDHDKNNFLFCASYNYVTLFTSNHFYSSYTDYGTYPYATIIGYNNIFSNIRFQSIRNTNTLTNWSNGCLDYFNTSEQLTLKGITTENQVGIFSCPRKYTSTSYSGAGGEAYPSINGTLKLSKIDLYESTTTIERGTIKGAYWLHHGAIFAAETINKIVDENNAEKYMLCMRNISTNAPSTSFYIYNTHVMFSFDESDW